MKYVIIQQSSYSAYNEYIYMCIYTGRDGLAKKEVSYVQLPMRKRQLQLIGYIDITYKHKKTYTVYIL